MVEKRQIHEDFNEVAPESKESEQEKNIHKESSKKNENFYEKSSEELKRIEEIRDQLKEDAFVSEDKKKLSQNIESVRINGKEYVIKYVSRESIFPAFGYATGNKATIREDLSPRVKRFVKAHELYHCCDKATWGGWIGREIRANIIPGVKDPLGLAATIWKTVSDVDRIKFYLKRIKERH